MNNKSENILVEEGFLTVFFVPFKPYDRNYLLEALFEILSNYYFKKNHIYAHSHSIKNIFLEKIFIMKFYLPYLCSNKSLHIFIKFLIWVFTFIRNLRAISLEVCVKL